MLTGLKRRLKRNRDTYKKLGRVFATYRNGIMTAARVFGGTDRNMVVFSAFNNRSYNDNPRYISEALHEIAPGVKIVWLFKDGQKARERLEIPDYITVYDSIERRGVSALARARVVVDNFNKRFYLKFPGPDQYYIQTWHGDRAFKKVGLDDSNNYNSGIEKHASLCVAGSDYGERQFRSAFAYEGEIMKVGTPRDDILVRQDPELIASVRQRLSLRSDRRYLLFAPTYRDTATHAHTAQHSRLDLSRALDTLTESTGVRWECLVRTHYMSFGIDNAQGDERFIDVTGYPEMGELMLVADALLTDYSSCAGDFALTRRPVFLYQDDIEDYTGNNRGLYFDMNDSPYWAAHDRDELDAIIRACTPEKAAENCDRILEFYGTHECGEAAKRVAERIVAELAR